VTPKVTDDGRTNRCIQPCIDESNEQPHEVEAARSRLGASAFSGYLLNKTIAQYRRRADCSRHWLSANAMRSQWPEHQHPI
jgi:hypothetical protein